jgi:hypothetical protein
MAFTFSIISSTSVSRGTWQHSRRGFDGLHVVIHLFGVKFTRHLAAQQARL